MFGHHAARDAQLTNRMDGLGPALRWRPRVEQELTVFPDLVDRRVAVTEYDHISIREAPSKPARPPGRGTAVVDHADPDPS